MIRRRRDERGSAVLETALIMPLLLLVLFGIIDVGLNIGLKQSVTHAAAEGARDAQTAQMIAGALPAGDNNSQCDAWIRVAQNVASTSVGWLSANNPTVVPTFNSTSNCTVIGYDSTAGRYTATGTPSPPVYLTITVGANSILPNLPGNVVHSPVTSSATVQVQ